MNIKTIYDNLQKKNTTANDYRLTAIFANAFIGFDKSNKLVYIVRSTQSNCSPFIHGTNKMRIECNVKMQVMSNGESKNATVHIFKFLSDNPKEHLVFLELCAAFFNESQDSFDENYVLDIFQTVATFFSKKQEYTMAILQGVFAELYTIHSLKKEFNLSPFWQSQDRMKFDFSLSEVDRLEIKSTIKEERRHHFLHEQLQSSSLNITIVSYLLRADDNGLSLFDLIFYCKPLMALYPKQYLRLEKILYDVEETTLMSLKFDESYILKNRKYFKAESIPKFLEPTPDGVINAQYDCILNGIEDECERTVIAGIKTIIGEENEQ
jgi:hypothetical protein